MIRSKKEIKKKLIVAIVLTVVIFAVFTIPIISAIAPLGNILLPGNGVWRVPGEVPISENVYNENLTAEVIVYRDEWGIPHVYAETEDDMGFALGYVHAQDRLFQMDMARRLVRGRLSEIIGVSMLESDKYNLAMGMEYWANETLLAIYAKEAAGDINYVNSFRRYVDGVNHYINTHMDALPLEYGLLGIKPAEWTLLDSLCFSKYMSKMLTWEYYDLYRLINYEALGADDYNELFPVYGPYQIPICPNYGVYNDSELMGGSYGYPSPSSSELTMISNFLSKVEQIPSEKQLIDMRAQSILGSNNWVVDGNKSSTGKPILSNDMHLAWNLPGIWYEGHAAVTSSGLNVYGFTLAGVPIPIVGHNQYVAWGNTNTGYDVIDWYFYTKIDDTHYNYNSVSTEYTYRTYTIPVKGQAPVDFTVKETIHGPVLNDFLGDNDIPDSLSDKILAPKWTGNNITWEMEAIYGYSHAKNRADFDNASVYFQSPAQNIVYADIDGNIGIRPTGLVPIRDNSNGTFPHDGSAGAGEWLDYIPFEDLPHTENPVQNYLASANQIAVGPNYSQDNPTYFLQNNYASGYRARRINELLNESANGTVGVEKIKEMQLDVKSVPARSFTPYIINATEAYGQITTIMNDTLTQLKNWDYDMDRNIAAPLIYRKWRDYMEAYTFDDEWADTGALVKPQLHILEKLMENSTSVWFDDVTTTSKVETRDDIVVAALIAALTNITEYYGNEDVASWRWGDVHKLSFPHLSGSSFSTLGKGPFEGDGEGYTVNPSWVGINNMNDVSYATGGASERMIVDFSDLDNSYSCIPSGQSGLSNSKHYSDQLEELFLEGKYHRQYFYSTAAEFPESLIESQIHFLPGADISSIVSIIVFCSAVGLIIGIVSIVLVKRFKTQDDAPKAEIPKKLTGGEKD